MLTVHVLRMGPGIFAWNSFFSKVKENALCIVLFTMIFHLRKPNSHSRRVESVDIKDSNALSQEGARNVETPVVVQKDVKRTY